MLRLQLSLNNNENMSEIHIQNDRTGDIEIGNYNVTMYIGPWKMDKEPTVRARVENHNRHMDPWSLVQRAIRAVNTEPYRRKNA